jgi:hypothetical protein
MYLVFALKDLTPLIEHAIAAPAHKMGYGETKKPAPALFLVKDEGIYLMSNGQPGLMGKDKTRNQVVYAAGHAPDDGWLGGDDFAETLEIPFFLAALRQGSTEIRITLTETKMTLEAK